MFMPILSMSVVASIPLCMMTFLDRSRLSKMCLTHSIYRERAFGTAYGVVVQELALLARAVFLIRPDKSLAYVEIVKEVSDEPDYDAVFKAAKA